MIVDRISAIVSPTTVAGTRRVLIVDDHAPTSAAIKSLLQREYPFIEIVATVGNGAAVLQHISDGALDVIVLDLHLGDEYGLDLMPAISRHQGIAVIILTSSDNPQERTRALAAGAAAFVSKLSPAGELIAAILAVRPISP